VDNGDGSWTLSVDEIDGVEITPPSNFSGEFDLTATATTTDDSGDTASVDSTFTVSVEGVADDAALTGRAWTTMWTRASRIRRSRWTCRLR
jgi:hypothetical protein